MDEGEEREGEGERESEGEGNRKGATEERIRGEEAGKGLLGLIFRRPFI